MVSFEPSEKRISMGRKMKKKLMLAPSIISLMVTIVMPCEVSASSSTIVSVDPSSIVDHTLTLGAQFSIDIVVNHIRELWGYQFSLAYSPQVLYGVSIENGPFLGSAGGKPLVLPGQGFDNEKGKLRLFGACLFPKTRFPTGEGVLAKVTFKVVGKGGSCIALGPETGLLNAKACPLDRDGDR